jgi:hypothetical protein
MRGTLSSTRWPSLGTARGARFGACLASRPCAGLKIVLALSVAVDARILPLALPIARRLLALGLKASSCLLAILRQGRRGTADIAPIIRPATIMGAVIPVVVIVECFRQQQAGADPDGTGDDRRADPAGAG